GWSSDVCSSDLVLVAQWPAAQGKPGCVRVARGLRVSAPVRVVFAVRYRIDTLEFFFHSSIPGLPVPLSTLRLQPRDRPHMARGQDGSLLLHLRLFPHSTSVRRWRALE